MRKAILRALVEIALFAARAGICLAIARAASWIILGGRKTISLGQVGLTLILFFALFFAARSDQ